MKCLILAGLLSLIVFCVNAQEITDTHINKADASGRRQGVWRVYDDDGNLKFTGEYINGKPSGIFTYYYAKGKVKAIVNQLDSGKVSYTRNYHPNGNIMAEGKYVNQKKDSTWLYYSEEEGTLSSEEHYVNTLKEGVWKTYYPEGQVAEEIIYRNDLKEGPWIRNFTDGTIKMKTTFIKDQIEGLYVVYHLNGNVAVSGSFVHSNKNGTWVYLNDIGELEKREEYENGKLLKQEIIEKPR
jgi:antitoxin component YwqK of YwqJK toxin-antitoxin module